MFSATAWYMVIQEKTQYSGRAHQETCGGQVALLSEDMAVGGINISPGFVLKKNNYILILNVTVPFENGLEAFELQGKLQKINMQILLRLFVKKGRESRLKLSSLVPWVTVISGV